MCLLEIKENKKGQTRIHDSLKVAEGFGFPEWVSVDTTKMVGVFKRIPDRSDLPAELNEQLVVELYSK